MMDLAGLLVKMLRKLAVSGLSPKHYVMSSRTNDTTLGRHHVQLSVSSAASPPAAYPVVV